jgi:hypothetical protein
LFSVFVFVFLTLAVLQYDQNAEEGVSNLVYLSKREKQTCKVREKKGKVIRRSDLVCIAVLPASELRLPVGKVGGENKGIPPYSARKRASPQDTQP